MKYQDFVNIMSDPRMKRYELAVGGDTRKVQVLYRYNLRLSMGLMAVIACFEVALRNAIDRHYALEYGPHWMRDFAAKEGPFNHQRCYHSARIINRNIEFLGDEYTPSQLVAKMDFGFWRFLFAQAQFYAGGQTLLRAFPSKPKSTPAQQYNHRYVFTQLRSLNHLRNRVAHHEPVCFRTGHALIDTSYARRHYGIVCELLGWLDIDHTELFYGLNTAIPICEKIDRLEQQEYAPEPELSVAL